MSNMLLIFFAVAIAAVRSEQRENSAALSLVQLQASARSLPRNGRIAVLMRGQSFRCGHMRDSEECTPDAKPMQLNATGTFIENFITPLEDRGNKLDIFYTDEKCGLAKEVLNMIGSRIKVQKNYKSSSAAERVWEAIEVFEEAVGGVRQIERTYDMFLFTRHDLNWFKPVVDWDADWSKFNFPSGCQITHWVAKSNEDPYESTGGCRGDNFYIMPGRAYGAFASQIGQDKCWGASGHSCTDKFTTAMKEKGIEVGLANDGGLCNTQTALCNLCTEENRVQCFHDYSTGVLGHDDVYSLNEGQVEVAQACWGGV